jgi:hypothetical protein
LAPAEIYYFDCLKNQIFVIQLARNRMKNRFKVIVCKRHITVCNLNPVDRMFKIDKKLKGISQTVGDRKEHQRMTSTNESELIYFIVSGVNILRKIKNSSCTISSYAEHCTNC